MSDLKTQFGKLVTADLYEGTLTIEVGKDIVAQAGDYAIVPIAEYERMQANGVSLENKTVLHKHIVIKRAFAYLLAIPVTLLYFVLLLVWNPIQYLIHGQANTAQKYHKYIYGAIERHGL